MRCLPRGSWASSSHVFGYFVTGLFIPSPRRRADRSRIRSRFQFPIYCQPDLDFPYHRQSWPIAIVIGAFITATITYIFLLQWPAISKGMRASKINLTLHNAVAYMYAMRKGGAELLAIFRSLSYNAQHLRRGRPGVPADRPGRRFLRAAMWSPLSATLQMTTPSKKIKDFLEDLLSVIETGGDMTDFLADPGPACTRKKPGSSRRPSSSSSSMVSRVLCHPFRRRSAVPDHHHGRDGDDGGCGGDPARPCNLCHHAPRSGQRSLSRRSTLSR